MEQNPLRAGEPVDPNGRYTVVRKLGAGGMASVYLVTDNQHHTEVALKILDTEQSSKEIGVQRFQAEYELIRRVSHRNIVQALAQGSASNGSPFFTMEYVPGGSLKDLLTHYTTENHLPMEHTISILRQIAEALVSVHTAGALYCDLKPGNVMLHDRDGEYHVHLIDFGIAQEISAQKIANDSEPQTEGAMVGTTLYMSPEQVRGKALTTASDIYSLGVVAYELCTGIVPFDKDGTFSVAASHLIGKIPEIRPINPATPKALERLILVCLSKDPEERYRTPREVIKRLDQMGSESGSQGLFSRIARIFG